MDRQEMKLREKLAGTGVSVTRHGDDIILNMPSNITFESGDSSLSSGFGPVLNGVTMVLDEFDKTVIESAGHTDSDGYPDYNQALSERRARAVASALVAKGINSNRVSASGFGERMPVASNSTESGKS